MTENISRMTHENRVDASIKGGMLEACAKHSDMFLKPRQTDASAVLLWTVTTPPTHQGVDVHKIMKECRP